MRNLKFFMTGVMVCALVASILMLKMSFAKEDCKEQDVVNASMEESKAIAGQVKQEKSEKTIVAKQAEILTLVTFDKKYQEEYGTENYEVVVKNTSRDYIEKITFTLGEGIYELFNMNPEESYKFVAYNTEKDLNLKVLSVTYETKTYGLEEEISLERNNESGKISGSVKNNGQRDLYPSQIVYFLNDSEGNTIQKVISYAGCFFEGLVIHPGNTHEFAEEIPSNYTLNTTKGVMVMYSDLDFKYTEQVLFK